MVFGYLRVSTSEQNEARQLTEMTAMGIDPARLYLDKCSGKDFNRPAYKRLIRRLRRGGRVSGAAAFMAGLLHIKPVMNVDIQGRLIPREKVKGRGASIKTLMEKLAQYIKIDENPYVRITHAECMSDALALKAMIQEKFQSLRVEISYVGAVIGAHAGLGTLALFFVGDGRE